MDNITGITVVYRTPELIKRSIESIKSFYPSLNIIIVNNSVKDKICTEILYNLSKDFSGISIIPAEKNIGHGHGLNLGMSYIKTNFAYIFDSDIEMIRAGMLENMLSLMNEETYGVGYVLYTNPGGAGHHRPDAGNILQPGEIIYLHPFSCLVSLKQYNKFPKYHSRGAPFSEAMCGIFETGNADKMIIQFPVKHYIKHLNGGTRARFGMNSQMEG